MRHTLPVTLPNAGRRTVLFAHRGARAHERENTLAAFELAVRLGATGLESDVWVTADGVAVLDHDGVVGGRLRRRPIASVDRSALPDHIPSLEELYRTVGADLPLSLDVKDAAAFGPTLEVAEAHGATAQLWLCHDDLATLAGWRPDCPGSVLVHSTFVGLLDGGCERHAADLRAAAVDAVNLHHSEWNPGRIALYRRFQRRVLAWDAQHGRTLHQLLDWGVDGLYSDHVDRMVDAASGRPVAEP